MKTRFNCKCHVKDGFQFNYIHVGKKCKLSYKGIEPSFL